MKFYSTKTKAHVTDLEEAVTRGLAPDGGLYMPERLEPMSHQFFEAIHKKRFNDIAFEVASHLLGGDVSPVDLRMMVDHTITFDAPLVKLEDNVFALELFHGPTLAFKDFGARFMSQLLGHFARKKKKEVTILVATSGDTGSAVANGFLGVDGTRVVVLYPSGKVSEIQEKQFTTLGRNISVLEIDGTFDDCQQMVKEAFGDGELQSRLFLTSANSINIARLIPQSFYYFYAWSRLQNRSNVVCSVPSGNFGNLTAGLMAKRLGLPINHFVASTNINDIVPKYLRTGEFLPRQSSATISNAMDVGNPSNFARILDLFGDDRIQIQNEISGYSFSDDDTREIMKAVFEKTGYILDPHGAVGLLGLKEHVKLNGNATGIFLETAHPAKFRSTVEEVIRKPLGLPDRLQVFMTGEKKTIKLKAGISGLKSFLLK